MDGYRKSEQVLVYRADANICNDCSVKSKCTGSRSGRHIFRSFYQDELDRAEAYRQSESYQSDPKKKCVGRILIRGGEAVSPGEMLSVTRIGEIEQSKA